MLSTPTLVYLQKFRVSLLLCSLKKKGQIMASGLYVCSFKSVVIVKIKSMSTLIHLVT